MFRYIITIFLKGLSIKEEENFSRKDREKDRENIIP